MDRRPDHDRNRTPREGIQGRRRPLQAGGSHDRSTTGRWTGPAATSGIGPGAEPLQALEAPPLDVVTTTRENALWVHLAGEADLGNHEVLKARLDRLELDGTRAVHLVLSELTFCDLSAFRHLIAFAGRVNAAGRELSAHGACPTLKKIARLLNVGQELHFV